MINWEVIIKSVVLLVVAAVTGIIIPWFERWLKSKLTEAQIENLKEWVKVAVEAAEQIFVNPKTGAVKKSYVIEFLHTVLCDLKIEISEEQLNNIIEAAVYELKRGG